MRRAPAVVVIGGGITGLTAAYRLLRRSGERPRVVVLEERARTGGNIRTDREDELVVDGGPDAFVVTKPHAKALCEELGLGGALIPTTAANRRVYLMRGGSLHALPEGTVLTVPTRFLPLARTPLFSWPGKLRMGLDLVLPARRGRPGDDESIASFVRRRLGREALERLAEPLLGGIYAGDVEALGIRATFPQLAELEDRHGSLIRGALAQRARGASRPKGPPPSPFLAPRGGMGQLVETLEARVRELGGTIRTGVCADAIERAPGAGLRVRVAGAGDEAIAVDHVVLAAPAHAAARMVEKLDGELASGLRAIPYCSTATVALAYPRADVAHALDAVGIIVPKVEGRRMLAVTFVSSKWEGRAPAGTALLRVFLGGHRDERVLTESDESLVALARDEIAFALGVRAPPRFARAYRFERANPQPLVGHGARVARLRALAAKHPGLHLAGAAYDGVGIPDCVRQATEVADRIASLFGESRDREVARAETR